MFIQSYKKETIKKFDKQPIFNQFLRIQNGMSDQ